MIRTDSVNARVFISPEADRTFVRSGPSWFERFEGELGDIDFCHLCDSQREFRQWIAMSGDEGAPVEIDDDFARTVRQEFREQVLAKH